MRKIIFPLVAVAAALFAAGCTGPEQKLGRGLSNTYEVVRWGELRRSVEHEQPCWTRPAPATTASSTALTVPFSAPGSASYEVVTFPIPMPTYQPMFAKDFSPDPVFPESYTARPDVRRAV